MNSQIQDHGEGNVHERARQLLAQERIEGITEAERAWVAEHVAECGACADFSQQTADALRNLRSMPLALPAGLAERTQFRVGLRAQQLREREPRQRALWIAGGISWAAGVASAPYVWRMFAWLGEHAGVPKLVWEAGFAMWWVVPALVAGVVLLVEHENHAGERVWLRRGQ
jgi:hypothetical protein